jgi:hypothetical protein
VRQLVPVLRHRQHPHGAERGNHRDIHDDPHGPIPRYPPVHTVRELRLLARSSGRERKSCGCGFQATKARVRFFRRAYPPCQRHRDAGVALARARRCFSHLPSYPNLILCRRRHQPSRPPLGQQLPFSAGLFQSSR